MKTSFYFAYGSNLNPARLTSRIGTFQKRFPARTLPGWRLSFNKQSSRPGIGFATIEKEEGGKETFVEGAIYGVSDEQISMLDVFEGVPTDYERLELPLRTTASNELVTAWVYVAASPKEATLFPTWDYLSHLLIGEDMLSTAYSNKLRWWPTVAGDTSVLFVYGSLRPDDHSGMPWTRDFCDKVVAAPAILQGARLYEDTYACTVLGSSALPDTPIGALDLTIRDTDTVRGYAIRPRLEKISFEELLKETDAIEGYPTLYQRTSAPIVLDGSGIRLEAYVYHRCDCQKDKPIPSGDWLRRQR